MPPITRAQLVKQKDLTVDELATLADTIMLSQANVQSLMAEVTADQHNAEVLAIRQRPSSSASYASTKEKKKAVKTMHKVCWLHQKWGREAKSCHKHCYWSGNGYWRAPRSRRLPLAAEDHSLQLFQSSSGPSSNALNSARSSGGSVPRQEPAPSPGPGSISPAVAHR